MKPQPSRGQQPTPNQALQRTLRLGSGSLSSASLGHLTIPITNETLKADLLSDVLAYIDDPSTKYSGKYYNI
jgi:hypothetical protein